MNENLEEIKAALVAADAKVTKIAADAKVTKIAADVAHLHDLIEAAGDNPSPEEWQEVKSLAANLNTALQAVDDSTDDVTGNL